MREIFLRSRQVKLGKDLILYEIEIFSRWSKTSRKTLNGSLLESGLTERSTVERNKMTVGFCLCTVK